MDMEHPMGLSQTLSITGKVIQFSGFLKDHGFKVFSSGVMDALRGLGEIDLSRKVDFRAVLRANLVSSDVEWHLFGELFEEFWRDSDIQKEPAGCPSQPDREREGGEPGTATRREKPALQAGKEEEKDEKRSLEGAIYSPVACLEKKDFSDVDRADIQYARMALKDIISRFRTSLMRRYRSSKRPEDLDFRRILKKSVRAGGAPVELFYRKRRKKLKRLVVLTDVSGSMDRYARFIMPFLLGIRGAPSKIDVFVFSTSLTPIGPILKRNSFEEILARISDEVPDWSGGTRIGYSLHQFNNLYGGRFLGRKTVVVIMSDGWDLGGRDLLIREMETLRRRAHVIVWLNPLAGDPGYKPVCRGMQAVLPYVDYLLPADSLQSLKKVGRTLARVMVRE